MEIRKPCPSISNKKSTYQEIDSNLAFSWKFMTGWGSGAEPRFPTGDANPKGEAQPINLAFSQNLYEICQWDQGTCLVPDRSFPINRNFEVDFHNRSFTNYVALLWKTYIRLQIFQLDCIITSFSPLKSELHNLPC